MIFERAGVKDGLAMQSTKKQKKPSFALPSKENEAVTKMSKKEAGNQ